MTDVRSKDHTSLEKKREEARVANVRQQKEITQKYIDPEKMTLVLVGDKEDIEKQMKEYERSKEEY